MESSSEISTKKLISTCLLANTIGLLLVLVIVNIGFAVGEIFIYPTIEDKFGSLVYWYYPAFIIALAFIALTVINFWMPLNLFREKIEIDRVFLWTFPLQSSFGCVFIMTYPTDFIGGVMTPEVLFLLVFLSIITGVIQGLFLFSNSWKAILQWLVISLAVGITSFVDLMTMYVENIFTYGFFLHFLTRPSMIELRFEWMPLLLFLLVFYLLPGLITSEIAGFISGSVLQSISLNELSPKFRKENSAA